MAFSFNYFIGANLRLAAVGPTNKSFIGNGGVEYGTYFYPEIIDYTRQIAYVATQAPVTATQDDSPKAFITLDNKLYTWGKNLYGELGIGNTSEGLTPYEIPAFSGSAAKVFVAEKNIYVIKTDGSLWGAGFGERFARSSSSVTDEYSFIQIGTATNWVDLATHPEENFALNALNEVYRFGYDNFSLVKTSVSRLTTAGTTSNGPICLMVGTDGTLHGYSKIASYAGLIPGEDGNIHGTPIQIGVETYWASVHGTPYSNAVFALSTDGNMYFWGTAPNDGYYGLGIANTTSTTAITKNMEGFKFTDICAHADYVTATNGFNQMFSWGLNSSGCLGIGEVNIDLVVNLITPVHNNSAPYYAIVNQHDLSSSSVSPTYINSSDITLPLLELSGDGVLLLSNANVTLPRFNASGEVLTNQGAVLSLPAFSSNGIAIGGMLFYGEMSLPSFSASGKAVLTEIFNGIINLPAFEASATGIVGSLGDCTVQLSPFTALGSALSTLFGSATIPISALISSGVVTGDPLIDYVLLALNQSNQAFTRHNESYFVANCKIGNVRLIGNSSGLFSVGGSTDDGVNIDAKVVLPMASLETATVKHIRTMYLDVVTDNAITVTVTFDTGESYTRTLGASSSAKLLQTLKFNGKRDIAGRSFSVEIQNTNGGYLAIEKVEAILVDRARTHGYN